MPRLPALHVLRVVRVIRVAESASDTVATPRSFRGGHRSHAPDYGRQPTDTALHAAPTAAYSVLPVPYRSRAAFSVAVRAPA